MSEMTKASSISDVSSPAKVTKKSYLNALSDTVDSSMQDWFGKLGWQLGSRPYMFIAIALAVTVACCTGFSNFVTENRSDKLWIPQGTQAQADQTKYTSNYNNPFRISYVIAKPEDNNALSKNSLLALMDLHDEVEAISVNEKDGVTGVITEWNLRNLCFLRMGAVHPCMISSVLEHWDYDRDTLAGASEADIQATLNNAAAAELGQYISGLEVDATGNYIGDALKITYFLENRDVLVGGDVQDLPAELWEEQYLLVTEDCVDGLDCYRFASRSFSDEFGAAIGGDIVLMNIGFLVIIVYLCVNLGKCGDSIGQRLGLSMVSVVAVGCAIGSSMGLSQMFGWPYTPVHSVMPFVLLGLGVDDSFVIMNCFQQTNYNDSMPQRMKDAMSHAGVSITVTSMTDFVAFMISTSTALPALASFCFYAATGIFFLFLYQCIMFGAMVAIDARRQANRKVDCCCCFTAAKNDEKDARRIENDGKPGAVAIFLKNSFAPFILGDKVAPAICLMSIALAAFGCFGASKLTVESNQLDFVPDGSYIKSTFNANDKYFGGDGVAVAIVTEEFDYFAKQSNLYGIKADLDGKAHLQTTYGPEFSSWFHDYKDYVAASCYGSCAGVAVDGDGFMTDETEFYDNLHTFLTTVGVRFNGDVIFDVADANKIITSKIDLRYKANIKNIAELEIEAMEQLRDECDKFRAAGMPTYPYTFEYLTWETFIIIMNEMVMNVGLCLVAVFVITLILIAQPVTALLVFFCVSCVIAEVLGAMFFWGLVIDNVCVINLTLAVGLAVDYSAHVGHCFMLKSGTNRERVIAALGDIGAAVLNGAISTFLAVVCLSLSESYVFRTLFKQFFLTCTLGVFNGMVFLPVLLLWFGPAEYATASKHHGDEASGGAAEQMKVVGEVQLVKKAEAEEKL